MEANESDELPKLIKVAWDLDDNPDVGDIDSKIIESKQQRINSIASTTTTNDVEMLEHQLSVGSVSSVNSDKNTVQ